MHTLFRIASGDAAVSRNGHPLEEDVADDGLLGRWYPLIAERRIGAAPLGLVRMGERLVLWRDAHGAVHVQEDRCPHRGARLSQGRVVDDTVACPYHGIMIDAAGCIAKVPALPGSPIEGRQAVKTYATRSIGGAVFAYFPTPAGEPPVAFTPPFEFASDEWSSMLTEAEWQTNWRYAVENVMDPMHGPYLHGESHSMKVGSKEDFMEITETETGFQISRKLQKDVAFDSTEFGDTGAFWMRLDIPYPPEVGPGGPFRVIGFCTPIDAHACTVFFWRLRKVQGWQRDLWRFLYRERLEKRHWDVLEQDRFALEGLAADARDHEILYQHDVGVTRLRRRFKALAREQLEAAQALAARPRERRLPVEA